MLNGIGDKKDNSLLKLSISFVVDSNNGIGISVLANLIVSKDNSSEWFETAKGCIGGISGSISDGDWQVIIV